MPGIYVRKASFINGKNKTSALIVPGSYWLSHKNNVYKFILRYHRLSRDTKQFQFGKELMKIIRRIIKCQPREGQQFITSHLLVTYSHASWTRQDRAFATAQFKERRIIPSSYAFMLIIKVLYFSEIIEQNATYTTAHSPQSLIQKDENSDSGHICSTVKERKNKKCLIRSFKDDFSEKYSKDYNVQEHDLKSESKSIQQDNDAINSNLEELSEKKELIKHVTNNENSSKLIKDLNESFKLPIVSEESPHFKHDSTILKKENKYQTICKENSNNNMDMKLNFKELSHSTNKLHNHNIKKNIGEYKDYSISDKNKILNDNSTFDDHNPDSVNLPYQYLIEEEIKNAKLKLMKRELEKVSKEEFTVDMGEHSDTTKIQQDSSCLKKKKYPSENVSRSSDITNLVMEGLMFTIRQGQDAVAVIEQKTKLEIDEVLENSEKIETKGGEKCLRNSSLLGLENLITMIELPGKNEITDKSQNATTQECALINNKIEKRNISSQLKHMLWQSSYNTSLAGTSFSNSNKNSNFINKRRYCEIFDKYKEDVKFVKNKRSRYEEVDDDDQEKEEKQEEQEVEDEEKEEKEEEEEEKEEKEEKEEEEEEKKEVEEEEEDEEEEEEDIVPEALQDEIFQSPTVSSKLDKSEEILFIPKKDLLMDDLESEELIKFRTVKKEHSSPFSKNLQPKICSEYNSLNDSLVINSGNTSTDFIVNKTQNLCNIINASLKKCKSNVPIIISNQIITTDEIPLPIQKILRNKLSKKHSFSIKNNEINEDNIEIQKAQVKDNTCNVRLEKHSLDNNILTNTHCLKQHHESDNDNKETYDESILPVKSIVKLKDISVSEKNINLKEEKSQEESTCTVKEEELSSNKMEDITEQFYQDFSNLQQKENLINENFKSKRKSLNKLNDVSNDEINIQMIKFFHDITRGAKVVIRRMSTNIYS